MATTISVHAVTACTYASAADGGGRRHVVPGVVVEAPAIG